MHVTIRPVIINGRVLLTGAKRMIPLKMKRIAEQANQELYITFMYSRNGFFSPVMAASRILVRCLASRAARNAPASMAVSPAEPPGRFIPVIPVERSETVANRLMLMMVNRFLSRGGQENTSEVPGGVASSFLRKLIEARPATMLFRPKTVSRVMISNETERRMNPRSPLTSS